MTTPKKDQLHTLYRFYASDGSLLYVGITNGIPQRFRSHSSDKPWYADASRVTLEHHPDRDSVLAAERKAIKSEGPRYNVQHNSGRENIKGEKIMTESSDRLSGVEGRLNPSSLVGSYFHSDPERQWQGCVVAEPHPGTYLVETFSWLFGDPRQRLVKIGDMAGWEFYDTQDWMTDAYANGSAPWQRDAV